MGVPGSGTKRFYVFCLLGATTWAWYRKMMLVTISRNRLCHLKWHSHTHNAPVPRISSDIFSMASFSNTNRIA
jgi:hypothetical protein